MKMSIIKSDLHTAQEKATAFTQATQRLQENSTVEQDTQSNVNGNIRAQEAIALVKDTANQLSLAISTASKNIQSIAEEFQALDENIRDLSNHIGGE